VSQKKTDFLKGLSPAEQQALKELSKALGIKFMDRPPKSVDLVVSHHG